MAYPPPERADRLTPANTSRTSVGIRDRRRRSQFQRRSHIHDPIQRVHQLLVRGRAIAEVLAPPFEITKELLDAPRGCEADEDASLCRPDPVATLAGGLDVWAES